MNSLHFICIFLLAMFVSTNSFGQKKLDSSTIIKQVGVANGSAQYKGGETAWINYVERHFLAKIDSTFNEFIGSKITATFFVEKDGKLSNIIIQNPQVNRKKLEEMYLKLFQNSPDWIPACKNNTYIRSKVTKSITICFTEE